MSHCCSSGNVMPSSLGFTWGGYGVKLPARGCTSILHVFVGHCQLWEQQSETAAHCSLSSADLFTGFQAVEAVTASKRLLESDHREPAQSVCWQFILASSPAFCSLLCLPRQLFLTPISHLHSAQNNSFPQYTFPHSPAN